MTLSCFLSSSASSMFMDPLRNFNENIHTADLMEITEDTVPATLGSSMFPSTPYSPANARKQRESIYRNKMRPSAAVPPLCSTWVTLFGFQPSQGNAAKAEIERLLDSEIKECKIGFGNYMQVRFESVGEARNALQLNGHLLSDGTMIGVAPYTSFESSKEELPPLPRRKVHVPVSQINAAWLWAILDWIFDSKIAS
jgi:Nup53/35/40-type RNA recognition motif